MTELGRKYTTRVFGTLTEVADFASARGYRNQGSDAWAGGSFDDAMQKLRDGDLALASQSDELLRKFEERSFPTFRRQWQNDVAGHVANVPAFIAGQPAAMRRRRRIEHEAAPVTVMVDLFISANFTAEDAMVRGTAVLALVRALAMHRAVTLYVSFATTARSGVTLCPVIKIDTTPLDLARAAYVFCGVSFIRQIGLQVLHRMVPGSSPWPPFRGELRDIATEVFGDGTQLLIVSGGIVSDVTRDPAGWIEARLREAAPEVLGEAA